MIGMRVCHTERSIPWMHDNRSERKKKVSHNDIFCCSHPSMYVQDAAVHNDSLKEVGMSDGEGNAPEKIQD